MPGEMGVHTFVGELQGGANQELGLATAQVMPSVARAPTALPLNREGRARVLITGSTDFPRQGKVMNLVMVHAESPVRRRRRWDERARARRASLF